MANLILGAVTNYSYKEISCWINSIKLSGYSDKIALIVYNMNATTVKRLERDGVELYIFNTNSKGDCTFQEYENFYIMVDRFLHAAIFLTQKSDINNVIFTDVKDVIFQRDPFLNISEKMISVASENLTYENEPWGKNNILSSFGSFFYKKIEKEKIYCAGVIGGTRKAIIDLFLNIFLISKSTIQRVPGGGGPDQAALNIILNMEQYKNNTQFFTGNDNWALHAGTTLPAINAGSGGIGILANKFDENKLTSKTPVVINDNICNSKGEIFSIVHQYDRIPEWNTLVLNKYERP